MSYLAVLGIVFALNTMVRTQDPTAGDVGLVTSLLGRFSSAAAEGYRKRREWVLISVLVLLYPLALIVMYSGLLMVPLFLNLRLDCERSYGDGTGRDWRLLMEVFVGDADVCGEAYLLWNIMMVAVVVPFWWVLVVLPTLSADDLPRNMRLNGPASGGVWGYGGHAASIFGFLPTLCGCPVRRDRGCCGMRAPSRGAAASTDEEEGETKARAADGAAAAAKPGEGTRLRTERRPSHGASPPVTDSPGDSGMVICALLCLLCFVLFIGILPRSL